MKKSIIPTILALLLGLIFTPFFAGAQSLSGKEQPAVNSAYLNLCSNEKSDAIKYVNIPDRPVVNIGVSEIKDAAALFFKLYETYIKASADSVIDYTDIPLLLGPAMLLMPAFSGATNIPNELANITDDQIKTLLLVADEYELGSHAQKAKQIFKSVLVLAQTYFVFTK